MSCINLSIGAKPAIPSIFLPSSAFNLNVPFGTVGITCCAGKLPGFAVPLPNVIPPTLLAPVITAMNALINAGLLVLDSIDIPECALNGTTI